MVDGLPDIDADPALDPVVGAGTAAPRAHLHQPGPDRRWWRVDLHDPGGHDIRPGHQLIAGDLFRSPPPRLRPSAGATGAGSGNAPPPPRPRSADLLLFP